MPGFLIAHVSLDQRISSLQVMAYHVFYDSAIEGFFFCCCSSDGLCTATLLFMSCLKLNEKKLFGKLLFLL